MAKARRANGAATKTQRLEVRVSAVCLRELDRLVALRDKSLGGKPFEPEGEWSTRSDVVRELIRAAYRGSNQVGEYRP